MNGLQVPCLQLAEHLPAACQQLTLYGLVTVVGLKSCDPEQQAAHDGSQVLCTAAWSDYATMLHLLMYVIELMFDARACLCR